MNNEQAKEVLLLYRPGTNDHEDPETAEALEVARRDPELAAWFAQHCAFQEAAAGAFQRIPVPEGLREQILSERKAHFNLGLKKPITVLAIAMAVIVISLTVAHFYSGPSENNEFSNFRSRMAGMIVRTYSNSQMDLVTNNMEAIRGYLASNRGHADYSLPSQLAAQVTGTGCAILPWHGKRVSMVCMNSGKNGAPMTPDLFLFIIDRSAIENTPDSSPQKTVVSGLASASWSSGGKTFVLLASKDAASLPLSL